MKAKTIRKVLKAKVEQWVKHVDDPIVAKVIQKGTIITGGSIASMLLKEHVNDYDVYFKDLVTAKIVAEYYVKKYNEANDDDKHNKTSNSIKPQVVVNDANQVKIMVKSAGIANEDTTTDYQYFEAQPEDSLASSEYVDPCEVQEHLGDLIEEGDARAGTDKPNYRPVFMSSNAITLSNKIQIVIRFYGSPDEIHENYDFAHCTSWWSSWDNKLVLRPEAMEALLAKELRYQGSLYPLCSIIRTRKFIKRGFTINAGQYLKMCMQLNDLNLNDIDVLEDQLTGVDVAYFHQVIKYIQSANVDITTAYICEIIDRIF